MSQKIKVLIIDDSALVRRAITETLSRCPDLEVVGTAADPHLARDKILRLQPDVLTLDIEMPRMDGLTFLKLLMQYRPMPVVILSSLTGAGSVKAIEALQAGAIEVLEKSSGSFSGALDSDRLVRAVKAAARAKLPSPLTAATLRQAPVIAPRQAAGGRHYDPRNVILIGASTGGTEALRAVLTRLPADVPGICVVQHIPAQFSLAFAQRLNEICAVEVHQAKNNDLVQPGFVLIAPGGFHLTLERHGMHYRVRLNEGPPVHYQRPSVDVLFRSAVKAGAAPHALALLLTGMGTDGAASMLELRSAGARTVAQDESSCVVFGMPHEAIRLGAAQQTLALDEMAPCINQFAIDVALEPGRRPIPTATI